MEKFDKNMVDILEIQLALESYRDDTETAFSDEEKNVLADLQLLREKRNDLAEDEKIKRSKGVLARLNKALDEAGREKFIFYEDGGINYIYKNI